MNATTRNATIDAGLRAIAEWRRGDPAHLDRWIKECLTDKGTRLLMVGLPSPYSEISTESLRSLVAAAVASGY